MDETDGGTRYGGINQSQSYTDYNSDVVLSPKSVAVRNLKFFIKDSLKQDDLFNDSLNTGNDIDEPLVNGEQFNSGNFVPMDSANIKSHKMSNSGGTSALTPSLKSSDVTKNDRLWNRNVNLLDVPSDSDGTSSVSSNDTMILLNADDGSQLPELKSMLNTSGVEQKVDKNMKGKKKKNVRFNFDETDGNCVSTVKVKRVTFADSVVVSRDEKPDKNTPDESHLSAVERLMKNRKAPTTQSENDKPNPFKKMSETLRTEMHKEEEKGSFSINDRLKLLTLSRKDRKAAMQNNASVLFGDAPVKSVPSPNKTSLTFSEALKKTASNHANHLNQVNPPKTGVVDRGVNDIDDDDDDDDDDDVGGHELGNSTYEMDDILDALDEEDTSNESLKHVTDNSEQSRNVDAKTDVDMKISSAEQYHNAPAKTSLQKPEQPMRHPGTLYQQTNQNTRNKSLSSSNIDAMKPRQYHPSREQRPQSEYASYEEILTMLRDKARPKGLHNALLTSSLLRSSSTSSLASDTQSQGSNNDVELQKNDPMQQGVSHQAKNAEDKIDHPIQAHKQRHWYDDLDQDSNASSNELEKEGQLSKQPPHNPYKTAGELSKTYTDNRTPNADTTNDKPTMSYLELASKNPHKSRQELKAMQMNVPGYGSQPATDMSKSFSDSVQKEPEAINQQRAEQNNLQQSHIAGVQPNFSQKDEQIRNTQQPVKNIQHPTVAGQNSSMPHAPKTIGLRQLPAKAPEQAKPARLGIRMLPAISAQEDEEHITKHRNAKPSSHSNKQTLSNAASVQLSQPPPNPLTDVTDMKPPNQQGNLNPVHSPVSGPDLAHDRISLEISSQRPSHQPNIALNENSPQPHYAHHTGNQPPPQQGYSPIVQIGNSQSPYQQSESNPPPQQQSQAERPIVQNHPSTNPVPYSQPLVPPAYHHQLSSGNSTHTMIREEPDQGGSGDNVSNTYVQRPQYYQQAANISHPQQDNRRPSLLPSNQNKPANNLHSPTAPPNTGMPPSSPSNYTAIPLSRRDSFQQTRSNLRPSVGYASSSKINEMYFGASLQRNVIKTDSPPQQNQQQQKPQSQQYRHDDRKQTDQQQQYQNSQQHQHQPQSQYVQQQYQNSQHQQHHQPKYEEQQYQKQQHRQLQHQPQYAAQQYQNPQQQQSQNVQQQYQNPQQQQHQYEQQHYQNPQQRQQQHPSQYAEQQYQNQQQPYQPQYQNRQHEQHYQQEQHQQLQSYLQQHQQQKRLSSDSQPYSNFEQTRHAPLARRQSSTGVSAFSFNSVSEPKPAANYRQDSQLNSNSPLYRNPDGGSGYMPSADMNRNAAQFGDQHHGYNQAPYDTNVQPNYPMQPRSGDNNYQMYPPQSYNQTFGGHYVQNADGNYNNYPMDMNVPSGMPTPMLVRKPSNAGKFIQVCVDPQVDVSKMPPDWERGAPEGASSSPRSSNDSDNHPPFFADQSQKFGVKVSEL